MSYIALYRKYRPQTFSEMVGQEHITKILKNQIKTGKISHAYIFSGTRGTGKTTAAKVFARAINCLNPKDNEPCNECEACRSILDGNTTDVVEMDAASNNSVDNIRNIRQEVAYSTTGLKYKVYIIDEAHMLSTSAFNALLKTLEEPPANVVFILATTEEHKILPTILSRCIRFEFKKIGVEDIVTRLEQVLKDYDVKYEKNALQRIAIIADGGMRDALSILERCINFSDEYITVHSVDEIVGTVSTEQVESLAISIINKDIKGTEKIVEDIIESGKDLRNITDSLIELFLNILVAMSSEDETNLSKAVKEVIQSICIAEVNQIIKHLSKLDEDLRVATNTNVIFRAKMLELSVKVTPIEENKLLAKIQELEMKITELSKNGVTHNIKQEEKITKKESEPKMQSEEKVDKVKKVQEKKGKNKLKELDKIKQKTVETDNLQLFSALAGVDAYEENDTVVFNTPNAFAFGILNKDSSKEKLKQIVNEELEKECNVKIEFVKTKEENNNFENMMKGTDVPFEIVD